MLLQEGRAGYTPLHIAVTHNNLEMVEFLVKECNKINLDTLTYGQLTAYQLAMSLGHRDIVHLLGEVGCQRTSPPPSDTESDSDYEFE